MRERSGVDALLDDPVFFAPFAPIDFSSSVASPYDPQAINPAYDSGDHLHPNDVGYQIMGNLVPLRLLFGDNR